VDFPDTRESPAEVLTEIEKEVKLGILGAERSKQSLDREFGLGGWRPVPRFAIQQGAAWCEQSWRSIDDEKIAGVNMATILRETIALIAADFPARALDALFRLTMKLAGHLPAWAHVRAGTRDLKKGYKQLFPRRDQLAGNIITYVRDSTRRYRICTSLLFGATSSVNHFNRLTPVMVAFQRRFLVLMAAGYFDDFWIQAWRDVADPTMSLLTASIHAFGAKVAMEKGGTMVSLSRFLGIYTQLDFFREGKCLCYPTPAAIAKTTVAIQDRREAGTMSEAQASTLYSLARWVDQLRLALAAMQQIIMHRKQNTIKISAVLEAALAHIAAVVSLALPRIVGLGRPASAPIFVWTDAAEEKDAHGE